MSSPAISSQGVIYVGSSDHNLYAINRDGSLRWKFTAIGPVFSAPTIGGDGTIYFGTVYFSDELGGFPLYAVRPDGNLEWAIGIGYGEIDDSPAIAPDGTIYVGTDDPPGAPCSACLIALSPGGVIKWTSFTGFVSGLRKDSGRD